MGQGEEGGEMNARDAVNCSIADFPFLLRTMRAQLTPVQSYGCEAALVPTVYQKVTEESTRKSRE